MALEGPPGWAHGKAPDGARARRSPQGDFGFSIRVEDCAGALRFEAAECSVLAIVLGGPATPMRLPGNRPIERGDVFVMGPGGKHRFEYSQGLKLCLISFNLSELFAGHEDLQSMSGCQALFGMPEFSRRRDPLRQRLHLNADELVHVTSLIAMLKAEFDGTAEGRQTVIRSLVRLLVAYLSRRCARPGQNRSTPAVPMANLISHIQLYFREPIRIEDLARMAHCSPSQFRRNFKRFYDSSPRRFINQVRLHEACELLKDFSRDITTIAYETGFSSSAFFASQFKRWRGETPSEYRRKQFKKINWTEAHPRLVGACRMPACEKTTSPRAPASP